MCAIRTLLHSKRRHARAPPGAQRAGDRRRRCTGSARSRRPAPRDRARAIGLFQPLQEPTPRRVTRGVAHHDRALSMRYRGRRDRLEVPEAAEWWPRYDEYVWPVEQATPRTVRRRATTSPHGKMVPMDLIDEESGLCVMRNARRQGHDRTSTRHPVRDGGAVPRNGACDGRYERQRAEAGSPGLTVIRTPLTPSGWPLYADA